MRRWSLVLVALGAAGCYQVPDDSCAIRCDPAAATPTCPSGLTCGADSLCFAGTACSERPDAASVDAPDTDAPIAVDGSTCYGTGLVIYCPTTLPPSRVITGATPLMVDTSDPASECTQIIIANGVELCVIAADSLVIDGRIRAVGRRPLVLFGRTSLSINGLVDVSAGGAGTSSSTCASASGANSPVLGKSAGGGAGGSFGGSGGQGGTANDGINAPPIAMATLPLGSVRGGCAGGSGGQSSQGDGGGDGGLPGGAVYLLSAGPIVVTGVINASGSGGGGGYGSGTLGMNTGGGGGGSGGLIFLEAPSATLQASSTLLAHGGGGGGGSDGTLSGENGSAPSLTNPQIGRGGTAAGLSSGAGGSGSSGSRGYGLVGGDAGQAGSGGGGGGGAGLIRAKTTTTNSSGTVSPPVLPG